MGEGVERVEVEDTIDVVVPGEVDDTTDVLSLGGLDELAGLDEVAVVEGLSSLVMLKSWLVAIDSFAFSSQRLK